jgi:2-polyprenyl-6-methoxyphenol hydroxylase-like FAD-dependent oxidoreductase
MPASRPTVAFDVDGTLVSTHFTTAEGAPVALEDVRTLVWAFHDLFDARIIVWSGSGELYARQMAKEIHITQWVDAYCVKGSVSADIAIDDEDVQLGTVNLRLM